MKFDMHCHTKEGSMDGKVMIEEYIKKLKEKGFGGMLVSDHNSYDGYREWRDSIKGEKYLSLIKTQARRKFHEERLKSLMEQFDFVEVFNACESEEVNEKARKLARKYHKPGFGGSDAHRLECIGMAYTKLPDNIRCESDLIKYVKSVSYITCGGTRYDKTTKDKLGPFNKLLVESFFVYNKSGERLRRRKRMKELENLH